jgi:hypothetical protein
MTLIGMNIILPELELTPPEMDHVSELLDELMGYGTEAWRDTVDAAFVEVRESLDKKLEDAPKDGMQYSRQDGMWRPVATTRSHYQGEYLTVEEVEASVTEPLAGDYALVGTPMSRVYHNWHPARAVWLPGEGAGEMDPQEIANAYDSVPSSGLQIYKGSADDRMYRIEEMNLTQGHELDALQDGKLDKMSTSTTNGRVYAKAPDGRQLALIYSSDYGAGYIPQYDNYGCLSVAANPQTNSSATSKGYVDSHIISAANGMVAKITSAGTHPRIYGIGSNGSQVNPVYTYSNVASAIVQRSPTGQIYVSGEPTGANDATSKYYVDRVAAAGGNAVLSQTKRTAVPSGSTSNVYFIIPEGKRGILISFEYTIDGTVYSGGMSATGLLGLSESRVFATVLSDSTAGSYAVIINNQSGKDLSDMTAWVMVV